MLHKNVVSCNLSAQVAKHFYDNYVYLLANGLPIMASVNHQDSAIYYHDAMIFRIAIINNINISEAIEICNNS